VLRHPERGTLKKSEGVEKLGELGSRSAEGFLAGDGGGRKGGKKGSNWLTIEGEKAKAATGCKAFFWLSKG